MLLLHSQASERTEMHTGVLSQQWPFNWLLGEVMQHSSVGAHMCRQLYFPAYCWAFQALTMRKWSSLSPGLVKLGTRPHL